MTSGIGRSISADPKRRRIFTQMAYALAALVAFGLIDFVFSGGPRVSLVGVWRGTRNVRVRPGTNPAIRMTLSEVEVHIYRGGRFDLQDNGLDYSGQMSYDGSTAVLRPDTLESMPVQREPESVQKQIPTIRLTPNRDGATLTETETLTGGEPVLLRRQQP